MCSAYATSNSTSTVGHGGMVTVTTPTPVTHSLLSCTSRHWSFRVCVTVCRTGYQLLQVRQRHCPAGAVAVAARPRLRGPHARPLPGHVGWRRWQSRSRRPVACNGGLPQSWQGQGDRSQPLLRVSCYYWHTICCVALPGLRLMRLWRLVHRCYLYRVLLLQCHAVYTHARSCSPAASMACR